jgi:hypothetical protein
MGFAVSGWVEIGVTARHGGNAKRHLEGAADAQGAVPLSPFESDEYTIIEPM